MGKVASAVGGKGGGRPDMAQAGGSDVEVLPSVMTTTRENLETILSS